MKIEKTAALPLAENGEGFIFSEKTVQGAKVGKKEDLTYIISPRRFKLYTDSCDKLSILKGTGFIKWKRGETPFSAGDCFNVCETGEYELNGNCEFVVRRGE